MLLLARLGAGGIWDPYELNVADLARRVAINVLGASKLALDGMDNSLPKLGDLGRKELDCVLGPLGRDLPVAGFPSLGEFAPWREADGSYTTTHFHNVTCVICLIGK